MKATWQKITAMMIAVMMCVALIQTPLLAEESSEEDTNTVTSDSSIIVTTLEISGIDVPAAGNYPDTEVSIIAKDIDGNVIDAIDSCKLKWYWTEFIRETGDEMGGGMVPLDQVYSKEYFNDAAEGGADAYFEEFTLTAYASIELVLKDGYSLASDDSLKVVDNVEGMKYGGISQQSGYIYIGYFFSEYEKIFDEPTTDPITEPTENNETEGNVYDFVEGADGTWDGKSDYVVSVESDEEVDNSFERFVKATVGDHELAIGTEGEVNKGSTIVTIKADYLKTLSAGTYTITIYFTDDAISTTLTIKPVETATDSGSANAAQTTPAASGAAMPETGETMNPVVYIGAVMVLVACGTIGLMVFNRRKREV